MRVGRGCSGTVESWAWLEPERWESKGHLVVKALVKEGNIKYMHFLILLKNDFRSSVTATVAIKRVKKEVSL